MAGPWEKYQQQAPQSGPWTKYAQPAAAAPAQQLPAGATGPLPSVPGIQKPNLQPLPAPTLGDRASAAVSTAGDFVRGAAKGLANTSMNINRSFFGDPTPDNKLYLHPSNEATPQQQQQRLTPQNTVENLGYGAERVGEFLAPSSAESRIVSLAPKAWRAGARIATSGLSTGLVNSLQGGSFTGGAAAGAAGGAVGEALRAAAPIIAETALGVRATDRGYGKGGGTIGRAILDETQGVNPGNIAQQASNKVTADTIKLEDAAQNSRTPVSLVPTRNVAASSQVVAAARNNPETMRRTGQITDLLTHEGGKAPAPQPPAPKVIPGFGPPSPLMPPAPTGVIPSSVPASRALELRRGLDELKGSWNPNTPNDFADSTIGRARHQLSSDFHAAVPGSAELDQGISNLIPVQQRAASTDLNASILQRTLGRFGRPTGALIGATAGGAYGYKEGGLPTALRDATIGLFAPEILASPKTLMMGARAADSALIPPAIRALTGTGMQATRKSLYSPK